MTQKQTSQTIAEVAELPTTQRRQVSQVIAEVAYTPQGDVATPPPSGGGSPGAPGFGAAIQHAERSPQWTVDGKPANLVWTSVRMTANGGYESAEFILPRTRAPYGTTTVLGPHAVEQGQVVRAIRDNGDIFYEGIVAAPPERFQGETSFYTVGAVETIRRNATRLPYQLAGGTNWSERSADPFNYNNNEKFTLISRGKLIGAMTQKSEDYVTGNKSGFALMVANWPLQRIAFTLSKSDDFGYFNLNLYVADDAGALTLEHSFDLGAANPDGTTFDYILSNPMNTLSLVIECSSNVTPSNRKRFVLQHLRVNGIGTDDSYTSSDVMGDLGNRCGYGVDNIVGSATAAIPLDWTGPWNQLADSMAEKDDWYWLVGAEPYQRNFGDMIYAPFGGLDGERVWRGVRGEGIEPRLDILPLYNHVDVQYESPAGMPQTLERDSADVADLEDPTPGYVFPFPDPFVIEQVQDDNLLAQSIADSALTAFAQIRCLGQADVSWLDNGRPYDILPGDLLQIGGYDPDLPPQRVMAVEYKVDGTVSLDIGRAIDPGQILTRSLRRSYSSKG